ncbi:hypothetical protein SRABI128_04887 [Microbacterium sp. Bi128]|nr:hypothetical protein SRABI128_04887 [Microbacterium sp. Bi128]
MGRIQEAPARGHGSDRHSGQERIAQFAARPLQPLGPDPARHGGPGFMEDVVQVPGGDEMGRRDGRR